MKILAIETSCDETACAIVENGRRVLANVIASQIDLHAKTGGVVPEVAAREHVLKMIPVLEECMEVAGSSWDDIEALAITRGPGLISSLIIGTETASVISYVMAKPLIPVQHIVGHIYSNWLDGDAGSAVDEPRFPIIILTVSGGHNELILMRGHHQFEVLGETRDDAAGEAFDKVARILGLGYPGGPAIAKMASEGDSVRFKLPRSYLEKGSLDFSFSGLKTAVLDVVKKLTPGGQAERKYGMRQTSQSKVCSKINSLKSAPGRDTQDKNSVPENVFQFKADLAASFQEAVVEVLADKLIMALKKFPEVREVHLAGGVSANLRLREAITEKLGGYGLEAGKLSPKESHHIIFRHPKSLSYCTDNAAMIAAAAYYQYKKNPRKFRTKTNLVPTTSFEL